MGRVPFFLVVVAAARADDAPRCADDPFWIAADAGGRRRTCGWVSRRPDAARCALADARGVAAFRSCCACAEVLAPVRKTATTLSITTTPEAVTCSGAGALFGRPGPKADPIAGCAVSESEARARYYPREWGTDDVVDVTLHRDGAVSTANPYGAVGFAAWATAGVVYGGSDGAEVDAYTAADLAAFLESDDALVIHVRADFAMPQVVLYDRSDKTVEGHRHTLRWSDDTDSKSMFVFWDCWNIVFRELRLEQGEADSPGADVFYLRGGHHFLFDKLTFDYEGCNTETCDESMHFQSPVTFVTVQRCLFDTYKQNMNIKHGTGQDKSAKFPTSKAPRSADFHSHGSRLGNYGYDDKSARITFYENLFLNGNSREPKIDVGWVHLVNTLWIDEDSHSYYGIRAIAEGDVLPEVLVEGAYVENFDKIYYHEEGGLIAEDFCNVDEFSRDRASTPRAKADLSWCAPYDYYRMDPFDCHEVARVRANAGAVRRADAPGVGAAERRAVGGAVGAAVDRADVQRPSAAPTAPPDAAVRVGGSARAIHAGRMGLYVSAGEECGGRPFYDCADCPSRRRSTTTTASLLVRRAQRLRLAYRGHVRRRRRAEPGPRGRRVARVGRRRLGRERRSRGRPSARDGRAVGVDATVARAVGGAVAVAAAVGPPDAPARAVADDGRAGASADDGRAVAAPSTAAPSAAPCGAVAVAGSDRSIHASRMGVYVSRGDACAGRPFYECLDCAGASALYYDDELAYWFVGPNGCGSLTVAMYVVDAAVAGPRGGDVARRRCRRRRPRPRRAGPAPSRAPSAAPAPRPTPAPAPRPTGGSCEDSASWHQAGKPSRGCAYVAGKASRCSKEDADGVSAADACERACGRCDEPAACEDSASWYAKKAKKDCDYVAEQPEERCGKKGLDAIRAIDACPAACGACDDDCADSASWYSKKSKKDCAYVAADPGKRCSKQGQGSIRAEDACPAACGACDTPAPSSAAVDAACADSSSWTEAGRPSRGCAYVADKPSEKRCGKEDESGVLASAACAAACGACGPPPVSPFG
ncbi:hypothetical protein SO694_00112096 [Aureococcus anophagefferens]|uniref:Pectate lyase domain-containing protein n=1 Tax=Aureococcus anophagefferens TaxID=44056 RepID=A0ABR1FWP6_AURAN